MALRAGYYGLKNSVKKKLEKLAADMAGAKIIKTIGDGLNLTNAGKLNVTAATDNKLGGIKVGSGLEIVDGVLNVTISGSFDYSSDEFLTGQKWIDGKDIYGKTYYADSNIPATGATIDTISGFDNFINYEGVVLLGGNYLPMTFRAGSSNCFPAISSVGALSLSYAGSISKYMITIFYTKTEEE